VTRTYGYDELATRIEQVLGERPSRSILRAGPTVADRATRFPGRLTAGMPHPLPATSRTAPARFDADQVDAWLATHPRVAFQRAVDETGQLMRDPTITTAAAVARARELGLTWSTITQLLGAERHDTRTRAAIHKAYRER